MYYVLGHCQYHCVNHSPTTCTGLYSVLGLYQYHMSIIPKWPVLDCILFLVFINIICQSFPNNLYWDVFYFWSLSISYVNHSQILYWDVFCSWSLSISYFNHFQMKCTGLYSVLAFYQYHMSIIPQQPVLGCILFLVFINIICQSFPNDLYWDVFCSGTWITVN